MCFLLYKQLPTIGGECKFFLLFFFFLAPKLLVVCVCLLYLLLLCLSTSTSTFACCWLAVVIFTRWSVAVGLFSRQSWMCLCVFWIATFILWWQDDYGGGDPWRIVPIVKHIRAERVSTEEEWEGETCFSQFCIRTHSLIPLIEGKVNAKRC